jgi:hypothetical protein
MIFRVTVLLRNGAIAYEVGKACHTGDVVTGIETETQPNYHQYIINGERGRIAELTNLPSEAVYKSQID